jgi:tetratricopeptide (TPR) repeat protein
MAAGPHTPIAPFWTRVPRFFLFPLQPSALWRVMVFAALPALGAFGTSPAALAVLIGGLSILAWVFLLRFASRVLNETSLGRLSPADYSPLPDESMAYMPYKILALFMIPGFAVGIVAALTGETLGMVANLLVTLVTPAALMALVISRSLATGLNPSASWAIISGIGKPYALLCVFLFSLSASQIFLTMKVGELRLLPLMMRWAELQAAAQQAYQLQDEAAFEEAMEGIAQFFKHLKPTLAGAVWLISAVAMYFTLIASSMLGYVLYQYHQALGLEVEVLPGQRAKNPASSQTDVESGQIAAHIAEGRLDQALEIAYEAQRIDPQNPIVQERYNKLLHLAGKDERLINHSQRLIPMLLGSGNGRAAVETWLRSRERQPEFRPEDAKHVLQLAEAARANREPKRAMEILNGFDKAFKNHPLVPEVYFLGGCILCEDLHKDELADRFFATLCTRHPEHPRVEDALRMRDTIRRVRKAAANKPAAAS